MRRWSVLLVGAALGCGDDGVPVAAGSSGSTGPDVEPTSSVTGDVEPTTGSSVDPDTSAGPSTSASSSGSDSSGDDTTTGGAPTGHGRLLVLAYTGDDGLYAPLVHDYDAGVLAEGETFAMGDGGIGTPTLAGPLATYCYLEDAPTDVDCASRDLGVRPFADEQPIDTGGFVATAAPRFRAGIDAYLARVLTAGPEPGVAILAWTVEDGALGIPRVVVESTPERSIELNESVAPDDGRIAFVGRDGDDIGAAYVVSTIDDDADVLQISPTLEVGHSVASVSFVLDADTLVFGVDEDGAPGSEARYMVELDGGAPGAPMLLDDPGDAVDHGPPRIAPDGHALAYWIDDGSRRRLVHRTIEDGVPQPPVSITMPASHDVTPSSPDWSPDSRWLLYEATVSNGDPGRIYAVRAAGGDLEDPVALLGNTTTFYAQFPAGDDWLFFSARQNDGTDNLYRVDLSGETLAEAQKVNAILAPGASTSFELVASPDLGTLLYLASPDPSNAFELWQVDLSGETPGDATKLSAPLPADRRVASMGFSPDGGLVTYTLRPFTGTAARPVFLVDRSAPGEVLAVNDDAWDVLFLPE